MRQLTRALVATGALAMLTGACATLRERFPAHEDVFTPIALTLGEPRVEGGDTSYVLSASSYQLVTRDRDLLPDAKQALDQAAARYRRYFGEDAPTVTVHLRRAAARGDSARTDSAPTDSARSDASRGRREATVVVPQVTGRNGRAPDGPLVLGPLLSVTPVARAWLLAATDAIRPPMDGADSVPASPMPVGPGRPPVPRDDPRLPDWWETAALDILAGSTRQDVLVSQLARQPEKLQPLRDFFAATRPAATPRDSADAAPARRSQRGGRRRTLPPLAGSRLFDAQALAVAQFLAVKEGAPFVGDVTRSLAAGRSVEESLRTAREVPRDISGLETTFKAWLGTQRGD